MLPLDTFIACRIVAIMGVSVKGLAQQALALSVVEREQLASELLESTNNKELTEIDRVWLAVAEERYSELISGKDPGIPEADFFAKVREHLGWT